MKVVINVNCLMYVDTVTGGLLLVSVITRFQLPM